MKRIEYSGNRLKQLKELFIKKPATGIPAGIVIVLLASLVAFSTLARENKDVLDTDCLSTTGTKSAVSTTKSTYHTTISTSSIDTTSLQSQIDAQQKKENIFHSIKPSILVNTTGCTYSYSFVNSDSKTLSFSYDNGKVQASFPAEWASEIAPSNRETGSFCVTPNKTAVVCIQNDTIVIRYSDDKGKTWKSSVPILPSEIPTRRLKGEYLESIDGEVSAEIDFGSENCGYLLVCGGHGMSQEQLHALFKTIDGGKTWKYLDSNFQDANYVTDMYFTDSKTGYICASCAAAFQSEVYRTSDGGVTWAETELPITTDPLSYDGGSFAFAPYFIGSKGYLLVYSDDSPNNKNFFIYFISSDNGKTWNYDTTKYVSENPPYWDFYP